LYRYYLKANANDQTVKDKLKVITDAITARDKLLAEEEARRNREAFQTEIRKQEEWFQARQKVWAEEARVKKPTQSASAAPSSGLQIYNPKTKSFTALK
jgi:hypothetical protein